VNIYFLENKSFDMLQSVPLGITKRRLATSHVCHARATATPALELLPCAFAKLDISEQRRNLLINLVLVGSNRIFESCLN